MHKRQYIFLLLIILLLYLSFKIIQFEYKKYTISSYIKEQSIVIENIKTYLKETSETIKYIKTKAFKNKILKSENGMKMKGEDVIILTSEKIHKKFSGVSIIKPIENINKKEKNDITSGMTNFQKWIYFLLNKDIR